jgi:hypothetical protein
VTRRFARQRRSAEETATPHTTSVVRPTANTSEPSIDTRVDVNGAPVAAKDPYNTEFVMGACRCNCRANGSRAARHGTAGRDERSPGHRRRRHPEIQTRGGPNTT